MITNWLSRLRATFEARTKGDWRVHEPGLSSIFGSHVLDKNGATLLETTSYGNMRADGRFVALCGTICDELLAVVEAADSHLDDCINSGASPVAELLVALIALRTAVDRGMG